MLYLLLGLHIYEFFKWFVNSFATPVSEKIHGIFNNKDSMNVCPNASLSPNFGICIKISKILYKCFKSSSNSIIL